MTLKGGQGEEKEQHMRNKSMEVRCHQWSRVGHAYITLLTLHPCVAELDFLLFFIVLTI